MPGQPEVQFRALGLSLLHGRLRVVDRLAQARERLASFQSFELDFLARWSVLPSDFQNVPTLPAPVQGSA